MAAPLVLIACLVSSSFIPQASAQFDGDSLAKGDLAVWCIFDIVYFVITLLCFVPIVRLKSHRSPFIALCASTLFSFIQCTVDIAYIVTNQEDSPDKLVGLSSTIVFFSNWSSPLLYLALWLLLFDRYKQWRSRDVASRDAWSMDVLLFRLLFGLFAILMFLSTISSALYTNQLELTKRLIELRRITPEDLERQQRAAQMYLNAAYVFTAFWVFSALCITVLSVYVYRSAMRARFHDKITKVTLFVVTPLYVLGMIESIVFTIYFSPSVTLTTETQVEDLTLASDLISNFLYAAMSATVLALGLNRHYWCAPDTVVALANLGALPAGRYLELEDPPMQK